ncbi:MAG: CoA-binding protein [Nanoarchaeota archaeon]|mgnify:CR=1 FL=1
MDLSKFFKAKNIAIVGVSRDSKKTGHVIFRNLIDGNFQGNIFLVNPNAYQILNKRVYKSLNEIPDEIELAIIALPAKLVPHVLKDCGKKKIQHVIIISSGFKESGDEKLENEVKLLLEKFKIKCIGVNSLGVFDSFTRLDTLFIPRYRLKRPKQGGISLISQSGSVGASLLDFITSNNYGIAKFVSYGNATNVDESDILEYLGEDKETKVICMYLQGLRDGQKFIKIAKKVSKIKPVVIFKSSISEESKNATISHTASLAGEAEVYYAAFKQCNLINASSLQEMFDFARIMEKSIPSKGEKIQVITNGGGYGILSIDAIIKNNLKLAQLNKKTVTLLKKELHTLTNISNPIDLPANATSLDYKKAIEACLNDNNCEILLLNILYQIPLLELDIIDIISDLNNLKKKPIIVVATGGEFVDNLRRSLEDNNIPVFTFPEEAVKSIRALTDYYSKK